MAETDDDPIMAGAAAWPAKPATGARLKTRPSRLEATICSPLSANSVCKLPTGRLAAGTRRSVAGVAAVAVAGAALLKV